MPWLRCLSSIPHIPGGNERSRPEREEEEDESERSSVSRRLPRQHWKITLPPTRADPEVLRSSLTFLFFFLSATELDSTDFFGETATHFHWRRSFPLLCCVLCFTNKVQIKKNSSRTKSGAGNYTRSRLQSDPRLPVIHRFNSNLQPTTEFNMSSCRHNRIIYALSVQCIVYEYMCIYLICSLQVLWSRTCGSCPSRWCRTSSTTTGSRPPSLCPLLRLRCAPLLSLMFKFIRVQSLVFPQVFLLSVALQHSRSRQETAGSPQRLWETTTGQQQQL